MEHTTNTTQMLGKNKDEVEPFCSKNQSKRTEQDDVDDVISLVNKADKGAEVVKLKKQVTLLPQETVIFTRESSSRQDTHRLSLLRKTSSSSSVSSNYFALSSGTRITINEEKDWYGNTCLHHLFANYEINFLLVQQAISEFPHLLQERNQFGRLPLHYVVDRGNVNVKGLQLLLSGYPEGIAIEDCENNTPYQISCKWNHPKQILLMFLTLNPQLDYSTYLKLKYGLLMGSFAAWAVSLSNASSMSSSASFSFRRRYSSKEKITEDPDEDKASTGSQENDNELQQQQQGTITAETTVFPLINKSESRRFSFGSLKSVETL